MCARGPALVQASTILEETHGPRDSRYTQSHDSGGARLPDTAFATATDTAELRDAAVARVAGRTDSARCDRGLAASARAGTCSASLDAEVAACSGAPADRGVVRRAQTSTLAGHSR
jgi:hypothetical protein